jgi:hypothetical protein
MLPRDFNFVTIVHIGFLIFCLCVPSSPAAPETKSRGPVSKAAADRCEAKLKSLEAFAAAKNTGRTQATRFSEEEINSYLAFYLSAKYHPSLKSLAVTFEEDRMVGVAAIDFDLLDTNSGKLLPKLMRMLFSGTHTLTAQGRLIARGGKASFQLERARFDDSMLPKVLVEEIITAVGRKQKPPFDPLQPSQMPYAIDKVDVHLGYILVTQ